VFYRTPTPQAVKSWREQTGSDLFSPGRHPNSSRIGSGSRTTQSIVSICSKTASPCSARKPGLYYFSCRRISRPMPSGSPPSSNYSRKSGATASNSGTQAGMRQRYSACSASRTSRSVFPIIMMHPRPGSAPPISSMSGDMGPKGATRDTIPRTRLRIGPVASDPGRSRDATCSCTSTTTRKVQRLPMPNA
jgi:hypothetical protein